MRISTAATGFLILLALVVSTAQADLTTQPAAPATQPVSPVCDVYLVPFGPLGGDTSLDWAGKAMQQNLLTDLARAKLNVVAADKSIENAVDAQTAAKAAGAKFIITGNYQVADTLVRFTGQILDTASGKVLGGLTATGAPRDLFTMEDALSAQALQQLTQPTLPVAVNNKNKAPGPVPPALQPAVVVQIIQPPAVAQNGASSSYQGSALQQYVDSNRTPSEDFNQQTQDAQDRDTYDYGYDTNFSTYFGGFGYSQGFIYGIPSGGYRYGIGHRRGDNR